MSIASKIHPLRYLPTAALLLSLLCACSFYEYEDNTEEADPVTPTEKYINLSIVVSSGNEGTTRAPLGGENGDGREAGLERENKVTGITLMLYQDDEGKGINTTQNPTIDYIQYFPTMRLDIRDNAGTNYDHNDVVETEKSEAIEVKYTTGEQPLGSGIDKDTEYHVIVVANWDLRDLVTAGETTLSTVRELATSHIYTGNGIGVNATSFIMASEKDDPTIQLSRITPTPKENKLVYDIGTIRIERLAARVDFWMKGAEYKEIGSDNSDDKRFGYEYAVTRSDGTSSPDKFLLTAVTPFNLYKDKEYLIKHLNTSEDKNVRYLEDESQYSYVIDPKTNDKKIVPSVAEPDYYLNPLSGLVNDESKISTIAGEWRQTTQSLHESENSLFKNFDDNKNFGDDNFILCYPKENALMLASPLYYYATGVAIEGYYYKDGEEEGEYHVYYGFLRHQGEKTNDIYEIYKAEDFENENDPVGDDNTPMNFSVVRNNIYRISIDKITEKGNEPPKITWQIKVKKWDKFTHSTIYM